MSTLTVWKFNTPEGAENALAKLGYLQKQEIVKVLDAAIVTWPAGRKKTKTNRAVSTVGVGALGGAFWGMLFGLTPDAMLNVSTNNDFSLSIAATAAKYLEMLYQGTVTRRSDGRQGIHSFVPETRVDSFVSSICNVTAPAFPADLTVPGLSTEFRGMEQF